MSRRVHVVPTQQLTTQIYLGKVPETEAVRWIENIYASRNREGVEVEKIFISVTRGTDSSKWYLAYSIG